MKITAITGGIGSGKSVVSQLLRVMGFVVYDCDERAKWVMTHDPQLRAELTQIFGDETYLTPSAPGDCPVLNKPLLSARIFGDATLLRQMNACVHPAVSRDIQATAQRLEARGISQMFYESAILYESGFDRLSPPDEVWTVSAPLELRIQRAMSRDHTTRAKILSRIDAQLPQQDKELRADHVILNDDQHSIIAQVQSLIS